MTDQLTKRFDALVVGSGATGSIAVKELTERGLNVLLLEAGRDITEVDFKQKPERQPRGVGIGIWPRARAALRGQPIQMRRALFADTTSPFLVNDWQNPYVSEGERFLWIRGRQLGGRLNAYGRVLLRMSDYDFEGGPARGADRRPWPIRYADLEPWYDRIEEFIGLYGNADGLPVLPDGKYVGEAKLTSPEEDFRARIEDRWPDRRAVAWRYAAPNQHRIPLGILAARNTGRLTTRTDAVVRKITVDQQTGRADGAIFIDRLTKQEHRVHADVVVLCASTIESIRLLFSSADARHPDGLSNSSGVLGRYFMDQAPGLVFGSHPRFHGSEHVDAAPDSYFGPSGGVYIPMVDDFERNPDFVGGYAVQGVMGRFPVSEGHAAGFGMMCYGEIPAYRHNRVTLDSKRTDAWGGSCPTHPPRADRQRARAAS